MTSRKYPIGIQTFSRIIRENYVYVDKTDLVWKMTKVSPFVFLSRPRRFGKSLLSSTLHSYFTGEKILFEGLKIMPLEQEWAVYPVFHLDLSVSKSMPSANDLQTALSIMLRPWHDQYGGDRQMSFPGQQLMDVISKAYNQTSKQVVIKIGRCNVKLKTFTKRLLPRNHVIYILQPIHFRG